MFLAELYTAIIIFKNGTPDCTIDSQMRHENRIILDKIRQATVEVDLVGYPEDPDVDEALNAALQRGVNVFVMHVQPHDKVPNYAVIDNRIVVVGGHSLDYSNDFAVQDCTDVGIFVRNMDEIKRRSRVVR